MAANDIFSWDELRKSNPAFPELDLLREALGEEFPVRASRLQPPSGNPILAPLLIPFLGSVTALRAWAFDLQSLRDAPQLASVLADLGSTDSTKAWHAYYLIEVAEKLRLQGLDVAFEPSSLSTFQRKPDAELKNPYTNETFYLEISVQNLSAKQNQGFDLLRFIHPPAAFPDVRCAGLWLRTPTESELDAIEPQIAAAVTSAREDQTLIEIFADGILEMAACHRHRSVELDHWRIRRGLSGSCFSQGPPDETDEISRLRFKIQTEQRQLPEGYANLLWIQSNSIFNHLPLDSLISSIQEPIANRGHVAAAIIAGANLGEAAPLRIRTEEYSFERRVREGRFDHTLLMWNPRAHQPPSSFLRAALLRGFFDED